MLVKEFQNLFLKMGAKDRIWCVPCNNLYMCCGKKRNFGQFLTFTGCCSEWLKVSGSVGSGWSGLENIQSVKEIFMKIVVQQH
jgi:hypothetical protein